MRLNIKATLCLIFVVMCCAMCPVHAQGYVAYSLLEAQRAIESGSFDEKAVKGLGHITEPLAIVYDQARKDLIIIGLDNPSNKTITLDDFVVSLRAILKYETWPLVSIDKDKDTPKTRRQHVRYGGGIAGTAFGQAYLDADVLLKGLGLGKVSAKIWGVTSYFDMLCNYWKKKPGATHLRHRFWFVADEGNTVLADREGVMVIKDLMMGVKSSSASDRQDTKDVAKGTSADLDAISQKFAASLTTGFSDLRQAYPELARLNQLFRLVALSTGITTLLRKYDSVDADLDFWLKRYAVSKVNTPETYPLRFRQTEISTTTGKQSVEFDGGVELRALVLELNDGSITALRDIVVKSRPSGSSLTWEVPLQEWSASGLATLDISKSSTEHARYGQLGTTFDARNYPTEGIRPTTAFVSNTSFKQTIPNMPRFRHVENLGRVSPNVGGVLLEGVAQVNAEAGQPAAGLATGNFALIMGDRDSRIHPQVFRKFITSLWSVYFGNTDPGISIDPIAPGAKKQLVRYIGRIQNTDLARVMREADYVMKKWSVGTERPDIKGFSSPDEFAAKRGGMYLNSMSRFWFVPKDMRFRSTGDALIYQDGRMTVQTEFLRNNARGLQADPSNEDFARWFTQSYPEVAKRYPVYQDLFEYSKLVSLAKYLKDSNVPLLWYLLAHRDLVLTEESPGTVDALNVNSKNFKGVRIEGGVQLVSQPQYILDREARAAIAKAYASQPDEQSHPVNGKKPKQILNRDVSISSGQEMMTFAPQHSLSSGVDYKGVRYQTDLSINEEGFILTDRSMQTLSPQIHRYYLWETMRPIVAKLLDKKGNIVDTEKFNKEYVVAWKAADHQTDRISSLLNQVKNKKYSDEGVFKKDLKFILEGDKYTRIREIILANAHFKTQFDLVRYHSPDYASSPNTQNGEFGPGWHLLIPYRLEFSEEKTRFRQLLLPTQVTLIDLLQGKKEIFQFREDHPSRVIGYFPEDESKTLGVAIALMSDGTLHLEDKLGSVFNFDADGRVTEMVLSDSHHISIAYKLLTTFDVTPYQLAPVRQEGTVEIAGRALIAPKRLQVTDSFQRKIEFDFDDSSENIVWRPRDKEYKGALVHIAMMTDGSFQLLDRYGNRTAFSPGGKFQAVISSKKAQYVANISMGEQRLSFHYLVNREGLLCVNEAWAYVDASSDSPSYVIDYRYDKDMRLADHHIQLADGSAVNWQAN